MPASTSTSVIVTSLAPPVIATPSPAPTKVIVISDMAAACVIVVVPKSVPKTVNQTSSPSAEPLLSMVNA